MHCDEGNTIKWNDAAEHPNRDDIKTNHSELQ